MGLGEVTGTRGRKGSEIMPIDLMRVNVNVVASRYTIKKEVESAVLPLHTDT